MKKDLAAATIVELGYPVVDQSGVIYPNIKDAAIKTGVLANNIRHSLWTGKPLVKSGYQFFRVKTPDLSPNLPDVASLNTERQSI